MQGGSEIIDIGSIRSLPRSTTPWQMSVREMPRGADSSGMYRILIVVSTGVAKIRLMRATTEAELGTDATVQAVEEAMLQSRGDLGPARPPIVFVDSDDLHRAIAKPLAGCGVVVEVVAELDAVDTVLEAFEDHALDATDRGLIGASCYEAELAEAAARVASVEPWRFFVRELPIAVVLDDGPQAKPNIVVVLGTMGTCLGVACYETEDDYFAAMEAMVEERIPGDVMPFSGWSLTFDPAREVALPRREAVRRQELTISHGLYPQFQRFAAAKHIMALDDRHDARQVERSLYAIAALVEEHSEALVDGSWVKSNHSLPGGNVRLEARPDLHGATLVNEDILPSLEELPLLLPAEHVMTVAPLPASLIGSVNARIVDASSGSIPCLIVRATKKNAKTALRCFEDIDALAFGEWQGAGGDAELLFAISDDEPQGLLSVFGNQNAIADALFELVGEADTVVVVCVGGGTRRALRAPRPSDIVGATRVGLTELE